MTNTEAIKRLRAADFSVIDALPLKQLYAIAEKMGADISLAKCLRGVGFQYQELESAIRAVVTTDEQRAKEAG